MHHAQIEAHESIPAYNTASSLATHIITATAVTETYNDITTIRTIAGTTVIHAFIDATSGPAGVGESSVLSVLPSVTSTAVPIPTGITAYTANGTVITQSVSGLTDVPTLLTANGTTPFAHSTALITSTAANGSVIALTSHVAGSFSQGASATSKSKSAAAAAMQTPALVALGGLAMAFFF
jgi:hypothetical protein